MTRTQGRYGKEYFEGRGSFFYRIAGGYRDFRQYFDRLARWFRPYVGRGPVLDVGCAYGYLLARFDDGRPLVGCDVSAFAVRRARRVLPRAHLLEADAGHGLPYADGAFAAVFCTDVLEHIAPGRQGAALDDMVRVLAPGGHLCMTTPNRAWVRDLLYRSADAGEGHVGMAHVDEWRRRLAARGLSVMDSWTYLHGFVPGRFRRVRWLPECALTARKDGPVASRRAECQGG